MSPVSSKSARSTSAEVVWPERLEIARLPTPINRLERVPGLPGDIDLWVKHDELTGTELSGNKIRKLEFCFAEARAQGCDTVITCGGVQSNHCRATAILGAKLGFKVHLLLRGERPEVPAGNLLLDYLSGAKISYLPQTEWSSHESVAREIQFDYAEQGRKALFIPTGASDEIGLWGYVAAAQELAQDFERLGISPDYIVSATGSGGTQAGLLVGAELFDLSARCVAFNVCDDAAYFDEKVRNDVSLWKQRYKQPALDAIDSERLVVSTIEGYMAPRYGEATAEVFETIREIAGSEGLFLDPVYTGKAFHGMLSELKKGDTGRMPGAKTVVFVHTGGLFGLFPQQQNFDFPDQPRA